MYKDKPMRKIYILGIVFIFLYVCPFFIFAQTTPPGDEPGAQAERFKKETEKRKIELETKKIKAPEIEIKEEEEKPAEEGISFILKNIQTTGATIFATEDFKPIYQSYLGQQVTFKDLREITTKIKTKYKEKGHLTTSAFIPEQEIKDGVVIIKIIEGKVGVVLIEGNKWFSSGLLRKYFHSKKNEVLNIRILQRDLLRLNLNPDLEVKTIIAAGVAPETSDITLKVKDKLPAHAGFSVDNQGTRLTGKFRGSTSLRSSNLSGRLDPFYVSMLTSKSSSGQYLSYSLPIDTYGTKLGIDIAYFEMRSMKEFTNLDLTGTTQVYTPHISKELLLTENAQSTIEAGLEIKTIKKKSGRSTTSNDQMRLPYIDLNYSKIDSWRLGGQTTFSPRIVFGTENFLGASSRNHQTSSRADTGGFFAKYEQTLQRLQKMPFNSYIILRSQIQGASHTLASSEQFQLGGANSVRGYPEGDYLADSGGFVNFEWAFPLIKQLEIVAFADVGGGSLKKIMPGEKKNKFLAGAGGGLRARLNSHVYISLEWATPIGDDPTAGAGHSTFHFALQAEF